MRIFSLNNCSYSDSSRNPNTAPFKSMVCWFGMCGYLCFGLRISLVVKFPWIHICGITLWNQFNHHLSQVGSRNLYKCLHFMKCLFTPFLCITSDLLTKHIRKQPLGNSCGLRPITVGTSFVPTVANLGAAVMRAAAIFVLHDPFASSCMETFTLFFLHDRFVRSVMGILSISM